MFAGTQMCERSDARNSPLRVKLRKIFLLLTTASQYEHITHVINTRTTCTEYVKNFGFIGIRIFLLIVLQYILYSKLSFQETVLLAIIIVDIIAVAKQYFRYNNASKKFFNYVAIGFHPFFDRSACSCTA